MTELNVTHEEKTKVKSRHRRLLEEYDTIVQCKRCGKKQYLNFANGLKNGWSICCGYTMPIIWTRADIGKAVRNLPITIEEASS